MARVPGTRARPHEPRIYVGLPPIDDDAPDAVKDALAARAISWVQGRCPHCAAEPQLTAYVARNLIGVTFQHDPDCPVAELLDPQE